MAAYFVKERTRVVTRIPAMISMTMSGKIPPKGVM
jgi:hypothetical protein